MGVGPAELAPIGVSGATLTPTFCPIKAPMLRRLDREDIMSFLHEYDRYKAAVRDAGGRAQPVYLLMQLHHLAAFQLMAAKDTTGWETSQTSHYPVMAGP